MRRCVSEFTELAQQVSIPVPVGVGGPRRRAGQERPDVQLLLELGALRGGELVHDGHVEYGGGDVKAQQRRILAGALPGVEEVAEGFGGFPPGPQGATAQPSLKAGRRARDQKVLKVENRKIGGVTVDCGKGALKVGQGLPGQT